MTIPWLRGRFIACAALMFALTLNTTLAQEVVADPEPEPAAVEEAAAPALVSLGVSSGFPGFNNFSVNAAVKYEYFGLNLKVAPTAAGLYFGGGLRGYLPFGGFVPLYLGVGGGIYGESAEFHAVFGGHVPISPSFRLDFELGAARASVLDTISYLPWVSLGVSYVFVVETGGTAAGRNQIGSGGSGGGGACLAEPTEASLRSAFERTVRSFISNARATYGGSYTDLSYTYDITDVSMSGDSGTVTMRYSGSVRTVVGGNRESAAGTASASFRWNGCSWQRTSLDY